MTKLWIPNGNNSQTEIDVQIAYLGSQKSQLLIQLKLTREHLVILDFEISGTELNLKELKSDGIAVSLGEFNYLLKRRATLLKDKDKYRKTLESIKDSLKELEGKVKDFTLLRDKLATKILEFKRDRAEKRSKDRD